MGRKCVCNGLLANIDLGQFRKNGYRELPMITSGDDVANVARFLSPGATSYRAVDVIEQLLSELESSGDWDILSPEPESMPPQLSSDTAPRAC